MDVFNYFFVICICIYYTYVVVVVCLMSFGFNRFMPFLVLSGQLCEPGIEGTLFSLFMSLNNIGATLSSFFGASLASFLHISSDQFENFSVGICIQAAFTLLPVLFLHLIPLNVNSAMGMEKSK
mgnify:CR=1 FL=1